MKNGREGTKKKITRGEAKLAMQCGVPSAVRGPQGYDDASRGMDRALMNEVVRDVKMLVTRLGWAALEISGNRRSGLYEERFSRRLVRRREREIPKENKHEANDAGKRTGGR